MVQQGDPLTRASPSQEKRPALVSHEGGSRPRHHPTGSPGSLSDPSRPYPELITIGQRGLDGPYHWIQGWSRPARAHLPHHAVRLTPRVRLSIRADRTATRASRLQSPKTRIRRNSVAALDPSHPSTRAAHVAWGMSERSGRDMRLRTWVEMQNRTGVTRMKRRGRDATRPRPVRTGTEDGNRDSDPTEEREGPGGFPGEGP